VAKPWFRPKQYGFGFTPCSWEGLLATGLYIGGMIATLRFLPRQIPDQRVGMVLTAGLIILLTAAFLSICARTMEGDMRWRWGKD